MIDTAIVRVHGACITRNQRQSMGWSRGGLTSEIHALVDGNGLPLRLALTPGEAHDNRLAGKLLSRLKSGSMLLADRGHDADWIRELVMKTSTPLIFWPATHSLSVTYSWSRIEMIVYDVLIKTDWSLLAEQKLALLETISIVDSERRPPLEGLLSFLDHLQDAARTAQTCPRGEPRGSAKSALL